MNFILSLFGNEIKSNEKILSEMVSRITLGKLFNSYIKKYCFDKYHDWDLTRLIKLELYEADVEDEEKVKSNLSKKIYDGIIKIDKENIFWKKLDEFSKNKFETRAYYDECYIEYLSEQLGYYLFCLLLDNEYKFEIKEVISGEYFDKILNENDEEKILKFNKDYFENIGNSSKDEYNRNIQNNETNKKLTNKLREIIHMINLEEVINELITSEKKIRHVDDSRSGCRIT